MKFLRYGETGTEKPGVLDAMGQVRAIERLVSDVSPETIADGTLAALTPEQIAICPVVENPGRMGPCLSGTGNFLAIGLNYRNHAIESNLPIPKEPILFNKAPSSISGAYDDVQKPNGSTQLDWEVELAFVIGKEALHVAEEDALDHVFGYMICNDVSERNFQLNRGGQWTKGKCYPTFGPIGPWLVTKDEIPSPQALELWLEVNGRRVQNGSTDDMIFSVAQIVSYLSDFIRLKPGDIITTGTPAGVGLGMKPQQFLEIGDEMKLGIEGLGIQRQIVVASNFSR
ncbi:fumarylacetoacetate hydrolase family protein [Thalassospira alkalitolerans]|uniref:fumarylacetoacetate hydrolase family protein n=1 Tax=Thalassospira alkalitolerans TaxID=1293890 RepID=UPI003AA7C9CA